MTFSTFSDHTIDLLHSRPSVQRKTYRAEDNLAYLCGVSDFEYGPHENPFFLPHNRELWERGFNAAKRRAGK